MKLNERMKRRLTILGYVVVGTVLIVAVGSQFGGETRGNNQTEEQMKQTKVVTVAAMSAETTKVVATKEETEPTRPDIVVRTEPETEPSGVGTVKPAAALSAQTDRMRQTVQPTPVKPTAPSGGVLKNLAQKSNGKSVGGTPEAIFHEGIVQPNEVPTQVREPQYGATRNGKTYVPVFGWVDEIGEGWGTVAEGMYENRNKIDIMD